MAEWNTEPPGIRTVLAALVRELEPAQEGHSTVHEIAQRADYSERWTRHCLNALEAQGLIEWERGGIRSGEPHRSGFQVSSEAVSTLADLGELIPETGPGGGRHG